MDESKSIKRVASHLTDAVMMINEEVDLEKLPKDVRDNLMTIGVITLVAEIGAQIRHDELREAR